MTCCSMRSASGSEEKGEALQSLSFSLRTIHVGSNEKRQDTKV